MAYEGVSVYSVAIWDSTERPVLLLITKQLYDELPRGTIFYTIHNQKVVKGQDDIDLHERTGFLSFGLRVECGPDPLGRKYEHDIPGADIPLLGRSD